MIFIMTAGSMSVTDTRTEVGMLFKAGRNGMSFPGFAI